VQIMTGHRTWTAYSALDEAARLLEVAARQHASGMLARERLEALHSELSSFRVLVDIEGAPLSTPANEAGPFWHKSSMKTKVDAP
jgi:hypothetical protein